MTEIEEIQRRIFLKWQLVGETRKEIKELEREAERLKKCTELNISTPN